MGIEIELVFVREVEIDFVYFVRAQNDLVLVYVPKLTCFSVGIEIELVFVCGTKMTCF